MAAEKTNPASTSPVTQWNSIRLKNFRRFADTGDIEFAPITLLFGKNSSGKTSLLRAPLFLEQLIVTQRFDDEPPLSGPFVDFGSYRDLVSDSNLHNDIELSVDLDPDGGERRRYRLRTTELEFGRLIRLTVRLHWNVRSSRTQIDKIAFTDALTDSPRLIFERRGPNQVKMVVPDWQISRTLNHVPELSLASLRFYPNFDRSTGQRDRDTDLQVFALTQILEEAVSSIIHIGPLRDMPSRAYRQDQSASRADVSTSSESVAILARRTDALRETAESMRSLGMAKDVRVVQLAPGYNAIVLDDFATGRPTNLADVGFGISQVLPILVTLASARQGSLVLIEQPELHLHPDSQGELADVMVKLASSHGLGLVIESHSEHLLLRLQRRIAEGSLRPENVALYIVDGGSIRRAYFDEFGGFNSSVFPDGFFEEEWRELLAKEEAAVKRRIV